MRREGQERREGPERGRVSALMLPCFVRDFAFVSFVSRVSCNFETIGTRETRGTERGRVSALPLPSVVRDFTFVSFVSRVSCYFGTRETRETRETRARSGIGVVTAVRLSATSLSSLSSLSSLGSLVILRREGQERRERPERGWVSESVVAALRCPRCRHRPPPHPANNSPIPYMNTLFSNYFHFFDTPYDYFYYICMKLCNTMFSGVQIC